MQKCSIVILINLRICVSIYSTDLLTTSLRRHGIMAQGGEDNLWHLFGIAR